MGPFLQAHVLDAKYEPGARLAVLYAVGERLLIGELEWAGMPHAPSGMQLHAFEDDPALPSLRTVLDAEAMAGILREALPECTSGEVAHRAVPGDAPALPAGQTLHAAV